MKKPRHGIGDGVLWAMILLAVLYGGLMSSLCTLTGIGMMDGLLGVLLGLYICSRPAANVVTLLFFRRASPREFPEGWEAAAWVALNLLVLLAGLVVIWIGIMRFTGGVQ
jgi:hypothetical protein